MALFFFDTPAKLILSLRDSANREDIPALKRRAIFKCPAGTIHAEPGTARRIHVPKRNPVPQARHLCRTIIQNKIQPRRGGIFRQSPDDAAPHGALSVFELPIYKYASPTGFKLPEFHADFGRVRRIGVQRMDRAVLI